MSGDLRGSAFGGEGLAHDHPDVGASPPRELPIAAASAIRDTDEIVLEVLRSLDRGGTSAFGVPRPVAFPSWRVPRIR